MPFKPGQEKSAGRKQGVPNKATNAAREAISKFVDGNAHRLQEWLDQIADGEKKDGTEVYLTQPNPEKAFNLFQSIIEYHIPKLARTESDTKLDAKLTITWED